MAESGKVKVCLLGAKGEFDNDSGEGQKKLMFQIYNHMSNKAFNKIADITKFETGLPIGILPSFLLENSLRDFSEFDIVHSLCQRPFFPLNKGKAKLIITAYDFRPLLDPSYKEELEGSGISGAIYGSLAQLGMRQSLLADHLIAISTQTAEEAINLGYNKNNIEVINIGIDERYLSKIKRHHNKRFVIGYLGAFTYHKNVIFAVNAVKKMESKVVFQLWGKPAFTYDKLVTAAGGDKRIMFMGFAPENKITEIYDNFDAVVFPSLYEGFGIPIIEAQARGLPVIIYRKARIPKEVRKYCLEAEDEEHMAQIIEDLRESGYKEAARKKATAYARSFTWERAARQNLTLYEKIAAV